MTPKLVLARDLAKRDLEEATRYYRFEAGADAALRFAASVAQASVHIGLHPKSGSPRYAELLGLTGLRHWALKRFPHLIFYVERADCVEVWRVLHARSDIFERWYETDSGDLP